jgi:hypothetical protein
MGMLVFMHCNIMWKNLRGLQILFYERTWPWWKSVYDLFPYCVWSDPGFHWSRLDRVLFWITRQVSFIKKNGLLFLQKHSRRVIIKLNHALCHGNRHLHVLCDVIIQMDASWPLWRSVWQTITIWEGVIFYLIYVIYIYAHGCLLNDFSSALLQDLQ